MSNSKDPHFDKGIAGLNELTNRMRNLGMEMSNHSSPVTPSSPVTVTPYESKPKKTYNLLQRISEIIDDQDVMTEKYHNNLLELWKKIINKQNEIDPLELEKLESYVKHNCLDVNRSHSHPIKCTSLKGVLDYIKVGKTGGKKRRVTKRRKSRLTKTKRRKSRF